MSGYHGYYWLHDNAFNVPQRYPGVVPLSGYAEILPYGATSLPWQTPPDAAACTCRVAQSLSPPPRVSGRCRGPA